MRRIELVAAAVLAAVALAACGGSETPSTAPAAAAAETESEPQRLLVDPIVFDNLLALGYDLDRVVGVFGLEYFTSDDWDIPSPYLADAAAAADVEDAGDGYQPNVERILALAPDLILLPADQAPEPQVLERLEEIAPVVTFEIPSGRRSFEDWKGSLRETAKVLGGAWPERAESFVADFDERVERFTSENAELLAGLEVTIGNVVGSDLRLTMPGRNVLSSVADDLGLARPAAQERLEPDEYGTVSLSLEQIPRLDADIIFLEQRLDPVSLDGNPLWEKLPAVKAGNVVFGDNYWEYGSAGSAAHTLDDVIAAIERYEESAG